MTSELTTSEPDEEVPAQQIIRGVRLDPQSGAGVVDVAGEVDMDTIPQLKAALAEAAAQNSHVIVNLGEVVYMDSSGFGALLGATKILRPEGGKLHLVRVNDNIRRMLEITRLNTIFALHDSEAEAIAAVTAAATADSAVTADSA